MDLRKLNKLVSELSSYEETITQLTELESLGKILFSLPEAERQEILKKIELFSSCDAKPDSVSQSGFYQPVIKKYDFVHVNFTGVGSEWDGAHYGLVWQINPMFDSFTVIPTTSKKREEYADVFSIGKVLGLPKGETTLLVSDMTRISRRRVHPVKFNHFERGLITSRLKPAFIPRINEAIAVSYGGQTSFELFIKENTGVALPEDLSNSYALRFKPIIGRFEQTSNTLYYRLWNSDVWSTMKFVNPNQMVRKLDKIRIWTGLFSFDDTIRTAAEEEYKKLYKN